MGVGSERKTPRVDPFLIIREKNLYADKWVG
jgi:hypothetical protein